MLLMLQISICRTLLRVTTNMEPPGQVLFLLRTASLSPFLHIHMENFLLSQHRP